MIRSMHSRGGRPSIQRGVTSVQIAVTLAVVGLLNVGLIYKTMRDLSKSNGRVLGGAAATINTALSDYLKAWGPKIAAGLPVSNGSVTVGIKLKPTLAELSSLGHLKAVLATAPNGGAWLIDIETVPAGCGLPGPCNFKSTVTLDKPVLTAGGKVDSIALAEATGVIGADGGYSDAESPSTILYAGGWAAPNKAGAVAGTLAAMAGYGATNYTGLKNVGDACTVAGEVATSTTGQQLICRGTQFVTTLNSLPAYRVGQKQLVKDGDVVTKPTCEAGGTPAYSIESNQSAVDVAVAPPRQVQYATVQDLGATWRVVIRLKDNSTDFSANTYNITAIFHSQCFYL